MRLVEIEDVFGCVVYVCAENVATIKATTISGRPVTQIAMVGGGEVVGTDEHIERVVRRLGFEVSE